MIDHLDFISLQAQILNCLILNQKPIKMTFTLYDQTTANQLMSS